MPIDHTQTGIVSELLDRWRRRALSSRVVAVELALMLKCARDLSVRSAQTMAALRGTPLQRFREQKMSAKRGFISTASFVSRVRERGLPAFITKPALASRINSRSPHDGACHEAFLGV